jgi:hypothetical protein
MFLYFSNRCVRSLSGDVCIGGDRYESWKNQAHAYHARWCTRNRTDVVVHRSLVHVCREEIRRAPWFFYSRISYGQGAYSRRRMGCHGSPMGGKIQYDTTMHAPHMYEMKPETFSQFLLFPQVSYPVSCLDYFTL